jgi:hypothetical protein
LNLALNKKQKTNHPENSLVLVAHAYNPNYSGDRGQGDQSETSLGKQFRRPYL